MRRFLVFTVTFLFSLFIVPPVFAQPAPTIAQVDPCPINTDTTGGGNFNVLCFLTPDRAVPFIITAILVIAVVIALFFLIWGGIKWITSGGDKGKVESARNTLIAAIVGLIVIFLAWFIINIVLRFFTGSDISQSLKIPRVGLPACIQPGSTGSAESVLNGVRKCVCVGGTETVNGNQTICTVP